MSEPRTEAGKRLLDGGQPVGWSFREWQEMRDAILAIEAEAHAVPGLPSGLDWLLIFDRAAGGTGSGHHGQDRFGFNARVDAILAALPSPTPAGEGLDGLRRLLARVEWVQPMSNSVPSCPVCGSHDKPNHEPGCSLRAALLSEKERGPR